MTFSTHPPLEPASVPGIVSELLRRVENLELLLGRGGVDNREVEIAFSFPGALTVDYEGARYPVRRGLTVIDYAVTIDTQSSNATTWTVYLDGVSQGTITVPASTGIYTGTLIFPGQVGEVIQPKITDGSDGIDAWLYLYAVR